MSTRYEQRCARIKAEYGFDFPDDFYRFWEFVSRLSPLEPLRALEDLRWQLVGPFEILAGRFDNRVPKHSLLLHWRYADDPPEFFTVFAAADAWHWGYYLDDPDAKSGCVANWRPDDGFTFNVDGDTLFEAARLQLEYLYADAQIDESEELPTLERLRERLTGYATADRPEIGEEYVDIYQEFCERDNRIIAETKEGMGIVVPAESYQPLKISDEKLWKRLEKKKYHPEELIATARQGLLEGFPGAALKLGKELWGFADEERTAVAAELLDAAYTALGRETLRRVLLTHLANRKLPMVDILANEEP
jgi:hypothetical protein